MPIREVLRRCLRAPVALVSALLLALAWRLWARDAATREGGPRAAGR